VVKEDWNELRRIFREEQDLSFESFFKDAFDLSKLKMYQAIRDIENYV
jgi:hypothetical protein